jgi:PilZ domain
MDSIFFGDADHKCMEVPRCSSIEWIYTNCRVRGREKTMSEVPYATRRVNPRFPFFADAEVTLRDGTGVRAQLSELSSRGCYLDSLEPIPVRTKLHLRICDGMSSCELHGKVLYTHSGGGFGIFGMGVVFEEMGPEQHSAIDTWVRGLASRAGRNSRKTPALTS